MKKGGLLLTLAAYVVYVQVVLAGTQVNADSTLKLCRLRRVPAKSGDSTKMPGPQTNELLLQLYQTHGIKAVMKDEWVTFPGRNMRTNASIVEGTKHQTSMTVQLDVRFDIVPLLTIVESFAGVGDTREAAVYDAFDNFMNNTFHVLLAAFFNTYEQQVTQEEWAIGGKKCWVTINVGVRTRSPALYEQFSDCFQSFHDKLVEKQLRPGTHWVRLYYGQIRGTPLVPCEVLLNNFEWEEMQREMAAVDWPSIGDFYGVRIFMVVQVENGGSLSPENAVAWLADIVAPHPEFTEKEVDAAMAYVGVSDALADRAYMFTMEAWSREVLEDLYGQIRFSPEYLCFNASGEVVESGLLANEPFFVAANLLAKRYAGSPGYKRLVMESSNFNAIADFLNKGGKPKDLKDATFSPVILFLEKPTKEGLENASKVIDQHLKTSPGANKSIE